MILDSFLNFEWKFFESLLHSGSEVFASLLSSYLIPPVSQHGAFGMIHVNVSAVTRVVGGCDQGIVCPPDTRGPVFF